MVQWRSGCYSAYDISMSLSSERKIPVSYGYIFCLRKTDTGGCAMSPVKVKNGLQC